MVSVWEYFAVYDGDVRHDQNLAGQGHDGGDGYPGAVFVSALSGTGRGLPGNMDAVYLRVYVCCVCHEHIFYADTDNRWRCICDIWHSEKECAVCGGVVFVLYTLSAAGGVLCDCKVVL